MITTWFIWIALGLTLGLGGALFWRYYWFFRNPERQAPTGEGLLSPADGKVVYVRKVGANEPVISIKKGQEARIVDILKENDADPKVIIGVFMSPFDVHYNRSPLTGVVQAITHYPAEPKNLHMGAMHWRSLLNRLPLYHNSLHITQNERTVTRIKGMFKATALTAYIIQIAAKSVRGIDVFIPVDGAVARGAVFGMIRIGSQVDLVVPWRPDMEIRVVPGDRVRAGESVLIA
ncbi:MAG: phosphatidylserine decarboxylase [Desulfobulbaceae bacterium]|nr:MAG: phosphatidylserine decarboxylase [Desulfobulbaceae bacterium]